MTHLRNPRTGATYCGLDAHTIYTVKGRSLVGLRQLVEVDCEPCLHRAIEDQVDQYRGLVKTRDALSEQLLDRMRLREEEKDADA